MDKIKVLEKCLNCLRKTCSGYSFKCSSTCKKALVSDVLGVLPDTKDYSVLRRNLWNCLGKEYCSKECVYFYESRCTEKLVKDIDILITEIKAPSDEYVQLFFKEDQEEEFLEMIEDFFDKQLTKQQNLLLRLVYSILTD